MAAKRDQRPVVQPPKLEQRVRNAVSIYVLEDGQVVFGDLPPELAELAAVLAGNAPEPTARLAKTAESVVS